MLKYWIWLSTRQNVSGVQAIALLSRFGSAVAIYQADEEALKRGSDAPVPPSLLDKSLTGAEVILQQCYQKNIHVMTIQDAQYPARLRTIDDPPIVLYYKGIFPAIDTSPVIAMVGTRKASAYGLMQAKRLGYQVAKCGGMVVSGGAEGIDTMCLTGALSANRPVIAVLGCGVDVVYPASNRTLFEDIAFHGCLISEYPPQTPALGSHFPVRNRIISGLSLGVVVVEAALRSGSLITARLALEQNRAVYAVPGGIGSKYAEGCQKLIRDGAQPIFSFSDILSDLSAQLKTLLPQPDSAPRPYSLDVPQEPFQPAPAAPPPLRQPDRSTLEGRILTLLAQSPRAIDDVCQSLGCDPGEAGSTLIILEVRGLIRQRPDLRYALT